MRRRLPLALMVAGVAGLTAAGWLVAPALGLAVVGVCALAGGLFMDDGSGDATG